MEAIRSPAAREATKALSAAQEERYGAAIAALKRSSLGRAPMSFAAALDVALHHCEKARAFNWPESELRRRVREATVQWNAANAAAAKLASHFEKLDEHTGSRRLIAALSNAGMRVKIEKDGSLPAALASFLRALSNQSFRRGDGGYRIGPLRVGTSSRKRPSREVVLIILLAHLFGRVASHPGDGELKIFLGEQITTGQTWEVAADFASAALGRSVDANAAKKFLSDHADHLVYAGWPESGTG